MARKRLILTEKEKALIKGLTLHTDYNDQEITAIFSHGSRSINHREIGYFRDTSNPKYASIIPANNAETSEFLREYAKLEKHSKLLGNLPRQDYFIRVLQASEAIRSAVSNFNSPSNIWKSETFCVNSVTAWTYLIHAYFMKEGIEYHHTTTDGSI